MGATERSNRTFAIIALFAVLAVFLCGCAGRGHGKFTKPALEKSNSNYRGMTAVSAYDSAKQRFLSGDLDSAYEKIETSLAANPNVADALLLRMQILMEMGKYDETIGAAQKGRRAASKDARFPYYLGVFYERQGKSELAMEQYELASELDEGAVQYKLAVVEMMMELEQLDKAEEFLQQSISKHPNSPGFLQTYGYLWRIRGKPEKAKGCFLEALTLAPTENALKADLALSHFSQKEYTESLRYIEPLLKAEDYGKRRDLKNMAVQCYIRCDRPVEARTLLREMTKTSGASSYVIWRQMSSIAVMLNDLPLLHDSAVRMIALDSTAEPGYMALALYEQKSGNPASALKVLDKYHGIRKAMVGDDNKHTSSKLLTEYRGILQAEARKTTGPS